MDILRSLSKFYSVRCSSVVMFLLWCVMWLSPWVSSGELYAQTTNRRSEPIYTEAQRRSFVRKKANRTDPNLASDKRLRRRGRRSGFLGLFHPSRSPRPNIRNYGFSGSYRGVPKSERWRWNNFGLNYSGNRPPIYSNLRNRNNPGGLGWSGNYRGIPKKERWRWNNFGLNYSGEDPPLYNGLRHREDNGMYGYQGGINVLTSLRRRRAQTSYPSNYSGNLRVASSNKRWRRRSGLYGYQGNGRAIDPAKRYRTRGGVYGYQGNYTAISPEKRWRWNNYAYGFSGYRRAVGPKERWRWNNGGLGWPGNLRVRRKGDRSGSGFVPNWQGYGRAKPPFDARTMRRVSDYAPDASSQGPDGFTMLRIDDYAPMRGRTRRGQARYFTRLTTKSEQYLGDYPRRIKVRRGQHHPTEIHQLGRVQTTRERSEWWRQLSLRWNRIFRKNEQPNVFKKRQRRLRYSRGEAEWWEKLNTPNSVDPAEGGESDTGN